MAGVLIKSLRSFSRALPIQSINLVRYNSNNGCNGGNGDNKRKFVVVGNTRMNGDRKSITEACKNLSGAPVDEKSEVVFCPPFPYLMLARELLPKTIFVGGQNAYKCVKGPFTGEVSPAMLKDACAEWVILGHSDRRTIFCEPDELIAEKCAVALSEGLKVIACITETLEDREGGKTWEVISKQMCALACKVKEWDNVVVAYEALWSAGKPAKPDDIQDVHDYIRRWFIKNASKEASEKIRIQYGGCVNNDNCKELAKQKDIDGFLLGEISLTPDFVKILSCGKS